MNRLVIVKIVLFMLLWLTGNTVFGQSPTDSLFKSEDVLKVSVKQPFSFGIYSQGNAGGEIEILPDGNRKLTGTLLPLNFGSTYSQLILEVEAPKGAIISFYSNGSSVLTGSNGGRMLLKMGNTNPDSPFYIAKEPPEKTYLSVGGVLSVGNAATTPAGTYSGNIYISFVVE